MAITNGLVPYLQQQGVDTAYMADFIQGFKEMIKSGDDPKKAAYVMGMDIAKQLSMTILPNITKEFTDTPDSIVKEKLLQGFSAALENDTTLFTQKAAEEYFRTKQQLNKEAKQEKLYGANRDAGRKFLEENAKKDSVVTLPSGLQYQVLVKGEGEVPQATDRVKVHYEGRLIDGTVFDASARHGGEPAEFTPQQVIPGWTEALTMMPVGSRWRLFIPYDLAYGDRDQGQIKPYSTLIFDVELVEIVKK
jgi:FKBP-type peptidyl-prolyl cis-trans isomerase FklB